MEQRVKITEAVMKSYAGREYKVALLFPMYRTTAQLRKAKEELADQWAKMTKDSEDPIVKCVKVIYKEVD